MIPWEELGLWWREIPQHLTTFDNVFDNSIYIVDAIDIFVPA